MKKLALLAPLALVACMSDPYGNDPYDASDAAPLSEPYRAIGNEPFWSLEIADGEMRFRNAEGFAASDSSFAFTPDPRLGDVYQGQRIRATLVPRECSDTMSDRIYPDTVTVEIGLQVWRGCGAPVRFFETTDESGNYVATMPYMGTEDLTDTRWRIVSINGTPTNPDGDYFLNFTANRVQARFDCNQMNASYGFDGRVLQVGPMQATRMACPPETMEREGVNILGDNINVDRQGSQIVLANGRGSMTAVRTY